MSIRAKFNKNTILTKCRVCLLNSGVWWMFSSYGKNNIDLKEMYEFCTGLKVQEEDSYPKSMCNNCIDSLIETHSFLVKCQTACSAMESINNILALKEPDLYNVVVDIGDSNVIFEYDGTLEDQAQDNFTNDTTGTVYESNVLSEDLINPANNICIDAIKEESEDNIEADTRTENENSILDGMDDEGEDINKDLSNEPNSDCDEGNDSDYIEYENEEQQIPNDSKNKICPICSKGFKRSDTLNNHLRTHTREKPFECKECPAKFSSTCNLIRHARIHSGEKPYVCDICGKAVAQSNDLKKHKELHCSREIVQPGNQFLCSYCGITFELYWKFKTHLRRTHEKNIDYYCQICNRYYGTKYALHQHIGSHKGVKNYLCSYCGKKFQSNAGLNVHALSHTAFTQSPNLKKHKELSHYGNTAVKKPPQPMLCSACGLTFASMKKYNRHVLTTPGHHRMLTHSCKLCGRNFCTKYDLNHHMAVHTGIRNYLCSYCGKKFLTHASLSIHSLTHTGEKPYKCEFCGKCFTQRGGLKFHRYIHTGAKPFKCDVCGKSFKQLAHLNYHSLLHTGEKHHSCIHCGKKFTLKGNLKQHMAIHTKETPYQCSFCNKSFKSSNNMKKHVAIHLRDSKNEL